MTRCPSTAPDLWTVGCELPAGHDGPHRSNLVIWRDPEPVDLATNSDAWVDGRVVLAGEGPDLRAKDRP